VKVGDLVKSSRGHTGVVLDIGYTGRESAWDRDQYGPTVTVLTPHSKMLLAFAALEVISESR
jgi:hypothetical protein